jgi:cell division protein FtsQ
MRQLNADAMERPAPPRATGRKAQARPAAARQPATRQPAARQPAGRQAVRRRPAPRWRRFAWRAGAILVLLLLIAGGAAWLWRAGLPAAVYARAKDRLLMASAEAGYRLRQVIVEGRRNTPREVLLGSLGVHMGDPLLGINPADMKKRLEDLGWIRSVTVERRLPDALYIRISEDYPAAIWQQSGTFRLIDRDGHLISDVDVARFARLPVVVGAEAPQHTADLLDMLAREPDLAGRVRGAAWVGERRWNLHFDNGVDVKLPADSPQAAWSLLARLEREQSLLARDISVIDMRLPDRLVVRLGPAAELRRQPGNDT